MRLTMKERRTVIKVNAAKYQKGGKKQRGELLSRVQEQTGYHRKTAARLLRNHGRELWLNPKTKVKGDVAVSGVGRGRKPVYGEAVKQALLKIWPMMDYIAGKRLAPILAEVVPRLVEHKELQVSAEVVEQLCRISAATIDRLLAEERARLRVKRRHGTRPGARLKQQIAIRTFAGWGQQRPGYLEIDLVGHDGGKARGDYCQTLDVTDVASGWSEQLAVVNKAQSHVVPAVQALVERLPFAVLGIDSDNGAEFINAYLDAFCRERGIDFTRARAYCKNDSCYIEQKNWSIVRRAVGYQRYSGHAAVAELNRLYELLRYYNNFFMPSLKLREKVRNGARVTRRYDRAQTPFQRLMADEHVGPEIKRQLQEVYDGLNPALLRRKIDRCQARLYRLTNPSRTTASQQAPVKDAVTGAGVMDNPARCPQPLENTSVAKGHARFSRHSQQRGGRR